MNKIDLDDLLSYAEKNHMMDCPFQDVYLSYDKALKETYEDALADMYNSTVEAHDDDYFNEAV